MSEVKVDTISERTAAGGVTIDGVLIKDGVATFQTAAGSPLVFEGATADAFETTFAITDPTADRTITFPDADVTLGAAEDNTPSFSAYNPLEQTLTSSGYDLVAATTELYDTGPCYDTTAKKFTVPAGEGGKYVVWARCLGHNSGGVNESNQFGIYIYLNGVSNQRLVDTDSGKFTTSGAAFCSVFDLSATDYLELYLYSVATSNSTVLLSGPISNSWGAFKLAGV